LSSESSLILLVVKVLSPVLPLLLTIGDTHISLTVSSVDSSLPGFDTNTVLWDSGGRRRVLELLTLVWGSLGLQKSRSVWWSSLSLEGSSISLVVKVLSPGLMLLLTVNDAHISLSISSVDSSLASHACVRGSNSGWRLLELLSLVWSGLNLDSRSVRRSGLSFKSGGILLVVQVLSPSLPILLTVDNTHIRLAVSSVYGGLS
jgi:hypothetical protein